MAFSVPLDVPASTPARVLVIALIATGAHLLVWGVRLLSERLMRPRSENYQEWARRFPKIVTVLTLFSGTAKFIIYFGALGWVLAELGVPVAAYFASASVLGLAVGFGSQGLVQDVVTGLSLIFTDALDVGDMIEVGGQVGRVHKVGLRYTILENTFRQQVFLPNRNITQFNRYPSGGLPVNVDVEVPGGINPEELEWKLGEVCQGMRHEFPSIILDEPRIRSPRAVGPEGWEYLRVRMKIWPGQGNLVETTLKQRCLGVLRDSVSDYPDWKVTVTYRS